MRWDADARAKWRNFQAKTGSSTNANHAKTHRFGAGTEGGSCATEERGVHLHEAACKHPEATKAMVTELIATKGLPTLKSGTITAEEIDSKELIDQHYYAIASKTTILKPAQLNVPSEKFEGQFGVGWQAHSTLAMSITPWRDRE